MSNYSWLIGTAVLENILQSAVTDSIEQNADFHYKSGLSPKIVRTSSGHCCDWCDAVAGTYEYPDVPKDVYRRHKRCDCTVEYHPGNGKRQNVWSKKWQPSKETIAKRRLIGLKNVVIPTNSGIIDIEVDEFVPCLKNIKTGALVGTVVHKIENPRTLSGYNEKNGWYINWGDEIARGQEVYSITLKNDNQIQGLVSLNNDSANSAVYGNWIVAAPHNKGADKKYAGVGGHLIAIAGQKSVDYGYDGFFWGKAANRKLYEYYLKAFNGTAISPSEYTFYIDEDSMKMLMEIYTLEMEK